MSSDATPSDLRSRNPAPLPQSLPRVQPGALCVAGPDPDEGDRTHPNRR
jgi:hypothetical protein